MISRIVSEDKNNRSLQNKKETIYVTISFEKFPSRPTLGLTIMTNEPLILPLQNNDPVSIQMKKGPRSNQEYYHGIYNIAIFELDLPRESFFKFFAVNLFRFCHMPS